MNSSGQLIFLSSLSCIILCLITQHWIYSSSLPIYFPILWAFVVTILSTWISCIIFKHIIKADSSITLHPISIYLRKKFDFYIQSRFLLNRKKLMKNNNNDNNDDKNKGEINFSININNKKEDELSSENLSGKIVNEIDNKFIQIWYENISDDKQFSQEAKNLILKLSLGLNERIKNVEKIQIVDKLAGVLIVHLKEYRRAVRRVEKGNAGTIEEAYNYSHPGSRSSAALEHTLGRLVTVIAREFLQWELGSSLPCKLLLSILARRLMSVLETISSPKWILQHLVHQLNTKTEVDGKIENSTVNNAKEGIIPTALSDGIASATAAAIARPLTKPNFIKLPEVRIEESNNFHESQKNSPQHFHEPIEHTAQHRRGLWGDGVGVNSEIEIELDEDRISPIYEEPTDFASTIARLRNLLQQKSTATTPLQVEEKFGFCDLESPFTNISIPRIESYFSAEGSQQILYCIQFDDVEQRGVYTFETTCTTTRRRYSDFVQLHASLEEFPGLRELMSDIVLPEGGRSEMENYLKTICSRLGNEAPNILRRFLRPDSGIGKKADIVTPRFDRFLAKTVSGVFNTLKTVVPGFEMEQQEEENPFFQPMLMSLADVPWRFVQDVSLNKNFAQDLRQLVADRTDYCSVDTAYEAVDSVEGSGDSELLAHWLEIMNRSCDEVDELDTNLSLTCAGIDLACEILSGVNKSRSFQHEGFIKCFKLIFGNITEPIIQDIVCLAYDCCEALPVSSSLADKECDETLLDLQLKIQSCLEKSIPTVVKLFFSENDIKDMIKFTIGSLEVKKINRDLNLQILDVIASQILASCRSTHLKI